MLTLPRPASSVSLSSSRPPPPLATRRRRAAAAAADGVTEGDRRRVRAWDAADDRTADVREDLRTNRHRCGVWHIGCSCLASLYDDGKQAAKRGSRAVPPGDAEDAALERQLLLLQADVRALCAAAPDWEAAWARLDKPVRAGLAVRALVRAADAGGGDLKAQRAWCWGRCRLETLAAPSGPSGIVEDILASGGEEPPSPASSVDNSLYDVGESVAAAQAALLFNEEDVDDLGLCITQEWADRNRVRAAVQREALVERARYLTLVALHLLRSYLCVEEAAAARRGSSSSSSTSSTSGDGATTRAVPTGGIGAVHPQSYGDGGAALARLVTAPLGECRVCGHVFEEGPNGGRIVPGPNVAGRSICDGCCLQTELRRAVKGYQKVAAHVGGELACAVCGRRQTQLSRPLRPCPTCHKDDEVPPPVLLCTSADCVSEHGQSACPVEQGLTPFSLHVMC